MEKVKLNSREMIFLSSIVGAAQLYGIPNGFHGMNEIEAKQELLKLQDSLENKKYAKSDFYGNFTVINDVIEIVKIYALCDKYIVLSNVSFEMESSKLLIYFKDDRAVKIIEENGIYEISYLETEKTIETIYENINWISESDVRSEKLIIPQDFLQIIRDEGDSYNIKNSESEIVELEYKSSDIKIIQNGMLGRSNYYAIVMENIKHLGKPKIYSIMVINSAEGSFELVQLEKDSKKLVEFTSIGFEEFKSKINNCVGNLKI